MKRLRRLLIRFFLFGLPVIFTWLAVKTITFSSRQLNVEPADPVRISDQVLERLATAVRLPTFSIEGRLDTAAFEGLDSCLRQGFPLVDSLLERTPIHQFSCILKWQGQNSRLSPVLLLAHLDVVGVENDGEGWSVPPFGGILKDGYLWGRGTLDDKVSVTGILEAIEMLLAVDYRPQRTVYIALGHDEETGGEAGARAMARYFEENDIRFEFVLDEGSFIVENALPGCEPPIALIGLSEKGYATYELTANVPAAGHSSMPGKESAINLLSEAIVRLRDHPAKPSIEGPVRDMFEHVGPEMDLLNRIIFANLNWTKNLVISQMSKSPVSDAMLRTTMAPTILQGGFKDNVVPGQAIAWVNCRIRPGETVASTGDYMRKIIGDDRIRIDLAPGILASEPPPVSGLQTFGYGLLETTVRQIYPEAIVAPSLVVATTDARHYTRVADHIYRFLPVKLPRTEVGSIHGKDERIATEAYKNAIRFYRQLILNACK